MGDGSYPAPGTSISCRQSSPSANDWLEINDPFTKGGILLFRTEILHMPYLKAARVFSEIGHRVLTCSSYPCKVELKCDQLGIGVLKKHIIWDPAIHLLEFYLVIVKPEGHACLPALLSRLVEIICSPLVAVQLNCSSPREGMEA